ncbi:Trihelix transcription factor ASIL2 [Linum grandiflorum]
MDKEAIHQDDDTTAVKDDSPRKLQSIGGGGGDRLKRDEWSEGAVSSLLEAYETKWVLRNRAKLKGQDWEDVARFVSSRANSTRAPKTQTQCKNKIESMKKRYRSESAAGDASSSWPLYNRLHHLLRGSTSSTTTATAAAITIAAAATVPQAHPLPPAEPLLNPTVVLSSSSRQVQQHNQHLHHQRHLPPPPLLLLEPSPANSTLFSPPAQSNLLQPPPGQLERKLPPVLPPQPTPVTMIVSPPHPLPPASPAAITGTAAQNSHGSDGVDRVGGKEEVKRIPAGGGGKLSPETVISDKNTNAAAVEDTDSSTPAQVYSETKETNKKFGTTKRLKKMKRKGISGSERRRSSEYWEIAESIRWMAKVVVRSEQARMDTMREVEKMRIEADAKRGEIELKRTEILANTQLEIAKLFAAGLTKSGRSTVDSSLRIGRS